MTSTFFRAGMHELGEASWPPLPPLPSLLINDTDWWLPGSAFSKYSREVSDRFASQMNPRTRCLAAAVIWEMLAEIGIAGFFDVFLPEYTALARMEMGSDAIPAPPGEEIVLEVMESLRHCRPIPHRLQQWLMQIGEYTEIADDELPLMVTLYTISEVAMSRGGLNAEPIEGWQWTIQPEFMGGRAELPAATFLFENAARVYADWIDRNLPDIFATSERAELLNLDLRRFLGHNFWMAYLAWVFYEEWRRRVMERLAVREGLRSPVYG